MLNNFFFSKIGDRSFIRIKYNYFLFKKLKYSKLTRKLGKKVTIRKKSYRIIYTTLVPFFFYKKFYKKSKIRSRPMSSFILLKMVKKYFSKNAESFYLPFKKSHGSSKDISKIFSFTILWIKACRTIFKNSLNSDFFLKTIFIHKFIKSFMRDGRLACWYNNFLNVFTNLRKVYQLSPFLFFFHVFFLLKLPIKLRIFIKSGRIYHMPAVLPLYNQYTYLLKLLRQGIYKRNEVSFCLKVLGEFLDILFVNSGNTVQSIRHLVAVATETKTAIKYRKFSR